MQRTRRLQVLAPCGVGAERNGHEWNEFAQSFVTFLPVSSQSPCLSTEGHHHTTRVVWNDYRMNGASSFIRNLPSRLLIAVSFTHSVVGGSTVY